MQEGSRVVSFAVGKPLVSVLIADGNAAGAAWDYLGYEVHRGALWFAAGEDVVIDASAVTIRDRDNMTISVAHDGQKLGTCSRRLA